MCSSIWNDNIIYNIWARQDSKTNTRHFLFAVARDLSATIIISGVHKSFGLWNVRLCGDYIAVDDDEEDRDHIDFQQVEYMYIHQIAKQYNLIFL